VYVNKLIKQVVESSNYTGLNSLDKKRVKQWLNNENNAAFEFSDPSFERCSVTGRITDCLCVHIIYFDLNFHG